MLPNLSNGDEHNINLFTNYVMNCPGFAGDSIS